MQTTQVKSKKWHRDVYTEKIKMDKYKPYTRIDFYEANQRLRNFADHIESHFEELADILLEYESFEVVQDETARTIDLLKNLKENKDYFVLRIGSIASFLPRNQPLYSLVCFVVVPSLMAGDVHFRVPKSMRHFYDNFIQCLKILDFFPNIFISTKERQEFLEERSAIKIDPQTDDNLPITDVVLFTGTARNAEQLRLIFDKRTLFVANGSGHNPVIVSEDADCEQAVIASIDLQLYNQGQDCSAPNSILVHRCRIQEFMRILLEKISTVKVGDYRDRSNKVGPISEPKDLIRIQQLLIENRQWIDPRTPGIINTSKGIIEPTIICKPLNEGGNFTEIFAPVMFVQTYEEDNDLCKYFENPQYASNAMFISLFGTSQYIKNIVGKFIEGKILHKQQSILYNTHPHATGIERGTQPYGGLGRETSSISINKKIICAPTLPQRDIYKYLVTPLLQSKKLGERIKISQNATKKFAKDIPKLLGIKSKNIDKEHAQLAKNLKTYVDADDILKKKNRYVELESKQVFSLLAERNITHISMMQPKYIRQIRTLQKWLSRYPRIKEEKITQLLYSLPKKSNLSAKDNRSEQLGFFRDIYQLLFGKNFGPRLTTFLFEVDRDQVLHLLNV